MPHNICVPITREGEAVTCLPFQIPLAALHFEPHLLATFLHPSGDRARRLPPRPYPFVKRLLHNLYEKSFDLGRDVVGSATYLGR